METVGSRIRHIRENIGLSLDHLAKRADISKSFLWEVEQDRSGISGEKLLKIANALNASVEYLLSGQSQSSNNKPSVQEIPVALGELAEEKGLTYSQTLALLDVNRSIIARRSNKERASMNKEDWLALYDGIKHFLEDKK